ncbi:MAG: ESX secretion-associated protein EspG [Gordonia sp. (in: high G+C Gram-positive bacteria)]
MHSTETGSTDPSASGPPPASLAGGTPIDVAVLRRIGYRFGVTGWPIVLDMLPTDTDIDATMTADIDEQIVRGGLLDREGEPQWWLATALRVLSYPDRELEIRSFTESGVGRALLARRGHEHVFAVRTDGHVTVRPVDISTTDDIGAIVRRHCGELGREPIAFTTIAHPTVELADRLSRCHGAAAAASALHALGMPGPDAAVVARAFAETCSRTEIVAIARDAGVFTQAAGALGIFDSDRGRIVVSPSRSPDGRVWTTLSSGSGHRIAQTVGLLVETLPEGWWS